VESHALAEHNLRLARMVILYILREDITSCIINSCNIIVNEECIRAFAFLINT